MAINLASEEPSVMTPVSMWLLSFNLLSLKLFHNDCWQPNIRPNFEPIKAFKL